MKTHASWHVHVEEKLLQTLLHFFLAQMVIADERCQISVKVAERLRASRFALKRIEEVNYLTQRRAEVLGGLTFNLAWNAAES